MDEFKPRTIKFKAWNSDAGLLMRLDSIDCNKGELHRKHHILLQFTGLLDKEGEEIYEQDIVLIGYDKYRVYWNAETNGWYYSPLLKPQWHQPFIKGVPDTMRRFCSFFEMKPDAIS